ncbi:MAG: hypothetical protein DSY55_05610 [Clostridia bacterium]|nr:MAG: hypothetical protein DSY55_05610 [Clostridia bacterium]
MDTSVSYHPKAIFRLYPLLFLLATLWLGTETWKRQSVIWLVMFLGVGFITVRLILSAFAKADFDGETFRYHSPLGRRHEASSAQIALVEMGGRRNEALIIGYHPRNAAGLIDADHTIYIHCAPLEGQGELLDRLIAAMPPGRA